MGDEYFLHAGFDNGDAGPALPENALYIFRQGLIVKRFHPDKASQAHEC